MSGSYKEVIKCLKEWYNRPRLDQEEYISNIVDEVSLALKNCSDKELCHLSDAAIQHLQVLKEGKTDSIEIVLTMRYTSTEAG